MSTCTLLDPVNTQDNQMLLPTSIALSTVVLDAPTFSGETASAPGTVQGVIIDKGEECLPPGSYDNKSSLSSPLRLEVTV